MMRSHISNLLRSIKRAFKRTGPIRPAFAICIAVSFLFSFASCAKDSNSDNSQTNFSMTADAASDGDVNNVPASGSAGTSGDGNDTEDLQTEASAALTASSSAFDLYPPDENGINIDLTQMSSTMVYSQVFCMTSSPGEYAGLKVRMTGLYNYFHDDNWDRDYFACIILDATACCAQGIEFELTDGYTFPDDYPKQGDTVTVTGIFDTYTEGRNTYCILRDATLG